MNYYPQQPDNMADEKYEFVKKMLKEIYEDYSFKQKYPDLKKEFSFATPINLALYYSQLDEPKEKVLCLLHLEEIEDMETVAYWIKRFYEDDKKNPYNLNVAELDSLYARYEPFYEEFKKKVSSKTIPWRKDTLDQDLIHLMKLLIKNDQQYRTGISKYDLNHQTERDSLDNYNIHMIDSLYNHYGTYIGKTLVGDSNDYIMWAIIQHASLEKQEFYLPILQKAVENLDVKSSTLRYLVDRIYTKKYGYQVYGSQSAVFFGTEKQLKRAKRRFNLD